MQCVDRVATSGCDSSDYMSGNILDTDLLHPFLFFHILVCNKRAKYLTERKIMVYIIKLVQCSQIIKLEIGERLRKRWT